MQKRGSGWGCQGGCKPRIEFIVKMHKNVGWGSGRGRVGSGWW